MRDNLRMSAAAIIMHRQRQFVRRFRDAGATSPATARSLDDLGMQTHWIFRRMAREGVFRSVHPDRWYLDASAWERFEQRQWQRLVTFIVVSAIAFILLLLLILLR